MIVAINFFRDAGIRQRLVERYGAWSATSTVEGGAAPFGQPWLLTVRKTLDGI